MGITEFDTKYKEQVQKLLIQLQEHLIKQDTQNVLVMKDCYEQGYYQYLLKEVERKNGKIYIYLKKDVVIGMIVGYIEQPDEEDELVNKCYIRGYVSDLVVDKEYRNSGIGKMLIEKMESWLRTQGCQFIRINVLAQNETALKFYERLGYSPINIEMSKNS